ncbi:MAG: hypothetical protein MRZ79_07695 [Bacteroidia bacterium]|nr:hypothetical protein [Bacteroidia bacterium]
MQTQAYATFIAGLFLFLASSLFAQNDTDSIKIVEGSYRLSTVNMDVTDQEACSKCLELAKLDAIEKAFGRVMIQGNSTYIRNVQSGEEVETRQVFNMISESLANGEWIETLDKVCKQPEGKKKPLKRKKYTYEWVDCKVKGKVRKLSRPNWEMEVKTLSCPDEYSCEKTDFQEEEFFYVSMTCPVDGYVSMYLLEGEKFQRILPYYRVPSSMKKGIPIEAQESYIFFSKSKDKLNIPDYVHPLQLYANTSKDLNRLYVIYSPKPLIPPIEQEGMKSVDFVMPNELSIEKFTRWMATQRALSKDVTIFTRDFTIQK